MRWSPSTWPHEWTEPKTLETKLFGSVRETQDCYNVKLRECLSEYKKGKFHEGGFYHCFLYYLFFLFFVVCGRGIGLISDLRNILTNTVATCLGNSFEMMAKLAVISPVTPRASTERHAKHMMTNVLPGGHLFKSLAQEHWKGITTIRHNDRR